MSTDVPRKNPAGDSEKSPGARGQIETDESKLTVAYANFCRVNGTPEELIVDFGLNPQPLGSSTTPVPVTQRIVMNYFTSKRLLAALHIAVQRHEAVFGVLETDIQKRVIPSAARPRQE